MGHSTEILASILFAIAILHIFSIRRFQRLALKFREGSVAENLFHLLGEVEIVFGFWAGILVLSIAFQSGFMVAIHYVESLDFTEPAFVFVIMTIAATKPVLEISRRLISTIAHLLPIPETPAFFVTALVVGPLLGSFITEPAAMTVTALLMKDRYFHPNVRDPFKYFALAILFVNISIGGVLTHYAAPPVLMVAETWGWGLKHMFSAFGWKASIAVILNSLLVTGIFWNDLSNIGDSPRVRGFVPLGLSFLHILFLALVVLTAHHPIIFSGIFLFFLGVAAITSEYQDELKLRESLLVGFFLGGLVVLGSLQSWWLRSFLLGMEAFPLFLGATLLTAFLDNAALTYLGSQAPSLSEILKYALVSGAVAGGGLTVIANAPNPAGFAILHSNFGAEGISPIRLFLYALLPTFIAMACLWLLPSL